MKVSIEIPQSEIKRAAYLFRATLKEEKDTNTLNEAVEALGQQENITITNELLDNQADQIRLVFATCAIATKVKEIEKRDKNP